MQEYSSESFVRVHRSYAVNLRHLEEIDDIHVMAGGKLIPLSKNYRKDLLATVNSLK